MSDSASCSPTRRRKRVGRTVGGMSWCSNAGGTTTGARGRGRERCKRSDRRLWGYFDELLRTHYLKSSARSRRTTRDDSLCAPGHDGGMRVSRKNRVIKESTLLRVLSLARVHVRTRREPYLTTVANNREGRSRETRGLTPVEEFRSEPRSRYQ